MLFSELELRSELLRAVSDAKYEETTPIQSETIPIALTGRDVIGQAQTGTGKTCAFALPVLQKIDASDRNLQALVVCPTRELAIQITGEFRKLSTYLQGIRILPVYGGEDIVKQIKGLKGGVQIIIGTPGRIMDHMRRHTIRTENIRTIVLDEADEMLNMGFREDIETILEDTPEDRQTLLFSATMPRPILDITNNYQKDAVHIRIANKELTVENIEQYYFDVRSKDKDQLLIRLLNLYMPHLSMVFCNTKKKVDELTGVLKNAGYSAEGLHGDLTQQQRDRVMEAFRRGMINVLIATDVAARGIDVANVDIVFNYDLPLDDEYYVHRIGRTGRAGQEGMALSFVSGKELSRLKALERYCRASISKKTIPTKADVRKRQLKLLFREIGRLIAEEDLEPYKEAILSYSEKNHLDAEDIAAALLRLHPGLQDLNETAEEEEITSPEYKAKEGLVRLFISVGRMEKIRPGDIVGAIAGETGLPGKVIGSVDIHDKCTFVDVPEKHAKRIIRALSKARIRGHEIRIEPASDRGSAEEIEQPIHDDSREGNHNDRHDGKHDDKHDGNRKDRREDKHHEAHKDRHGERRHEKREDSRDKKHRENRESKHHENRESKRTEKRTDTRKHRD